MFDGMRINRLSLEAANEERLLHITRPCSRNIARLAKVGNAGHAKSPTPSRIKHRTVSRSGPAVANSSFAAAVSNM